MKDKTKVIAFYLPQFYPTQENNEWWGKGFTEWTNVGKARPLYPGHYQPRVPSELGYYDLRLDDIREEQIKLAKEAGITAFCYWHYWFGNGKQLLEKPLQSHIKNSKNDFPFCLGWGNHSWAKKNWNKDVSRFDNTTLIKQTYPGTKDIDDHFNTMLPAFKDNRYLRIDDKLVFYIYAPELIPDINYYKNRWQELAQNNGLNGFFFVAGTTELSKLELPNIKGCDAINLDLRNYAFFKKNPVFWRRLSYLFPFPMYIKRYSKAIKLWQNDIFYKENIIPTITPNWDHSPRSGKSATILHGSTPELFEKHVENTLEYLKKKPDNRKIVFLKSWNEWAEGNYMEPDMRYGKKFIHALKSVLDKE